jgi:hypothetical protein
MPASALAHKATKPARFSLNKKRRIRGAFFVHCAKYKRNKHNITSHSPVLHFRITSRRNTMSCALLIVGAVAASGLSQAPAAMNGEYWSSCGTSYCRGVHCATAPASQILNRPTDYGYSVKYNYGLQPDYTQGAVWSGSNSYNYGGPVRLK